MSNQNEHPGEEDNMSSRIWQAQPLEAPRISLEYVRFQTEKLNADFRRQLRLAYAVIVFAALVFALSIFWHPSVPPPEPFTHFQRLGNLLFLAAAVYLIFQLRRRGKVLHFPSAGQAVEGLHAYRAELLRRRDLNLRAWWSLWPIIPSLAVFIVGFLIVDQRPNKLVRYGLLSGFFVVGMLLAIWHGKRESWKFQRELDALSTLDS